MSHLDEARLCARIRHANVAASVMCHQCHKPICKSCVVAMPHGEFCSSECSALNKSVKTKIHGLKAGRPSWTVMAVGAFLGVILLTVLFHLVVILFDSDSPTRKTLGKFDLWEMLLDTSKEQGDRLKEKPKP